MRQKSKNWTESSSREHRSISCCSKSLANFNRAKALNSKSFNHRTCWSQNNTKTQKGTSLSTSRAFENCTRSLSDFKSSSMNWKLKYKTLFDKVRHWYRITDCWRKSNASLQKTKTNRPKFTNSGWALDEVSLQKRINQHMALMVVLFAEIETLRQRVKDKEK